MFIDTVKHHLRATNGLDRLHEKSVGYIETLLNDKRLVAINASSVVDFLNKKIRAESETFEELYGTLNKLVFSVTPPSPVTWIEYNPKRSTIDGLFPRFSSMATIIHYKKRGFININNSKIYDNFDSVITLIFLSEILGTITTALWQYHYFLNKDGEIINADGRSIFDSSVLGVMEEKYAKDIEANLKSVSEDSVVFSIVPLVTLSLLNIKNIKLVREKVDEKLQKKRVKNGKLPLVTMRTLKIELPGETKRNISEHEKTQPQMHSLSSLPESLVRGHFSDYRNGNGLFGKYKGRYYFPAHFRGNIENGVVRKRYEAEVQK